MKITTEPHKGKENSGVILNDDIPIGTWFYDRKQNKHIGRVDGVKKRIFASSSTGLEFNVQKILNKK